MALRQRKWARRWTRKLRKLLGGRCVDCGTTKQLEFDCIVPLGDEHHKREWSWRICFYRRQYEVENLALRCERHNRRKSAQLVFHDYQKPEMPF